MVFVRGAVKPNADHNPVVADGASRSTGVIESAAKLCDMLGLRYEVEPPSSVYYHRWGHECTDPKVIKCSWKLRTMDKYSKPVEILFDLTDGDAPLILGIYLLQFSDTCNHREPRVIRFWRSCDDGMRTMFTYIAPDRHGNHRIRLEVLPKFTICHFDRSFLHTMRKMHSTWSRRRIYSRMRTQKT